MSTIEATVTSKGQITIPVQIRKELGIHVGTIVQFVTSEDHQNCQIRPLKKVHIDSLAGILGKPEKKLLIEDMNPEVFYDRD